MKALITGILGQDGSILRQVLQARGFEVIGISRRSIHHWKGSEYKVYESSYQLEDPNSCTTFLNQIKPNKIFHLAAIHGSSDSFTNLDSRLHKQMNQIHVDFPLNFANWAYKYSPNCHLFVALTSQMYTPTDFPSYISEETPISPSTLYAKTKAEGWARLQSIRASENCRISCAILFNHTSHLSKPEFLFPTLVKLLNSVIEGQQRKITIRDAFTPISISSANEVCEAIFSISMNDIAGDYVLGNDVLVSPREIIKDCLAEFNIFEPQYDLVSTRDAPARHLAPIISKANTFLSWSPVTKPTKLLTQMLFQYRKETH